MKRVFDMLVPAVALAAGFLVAVAVASVAGRPSAQDTLARQTFEQFDVRQQEKIRSHARRLLNSEDEIRKLREVHDAVNAEPDLKSKLQQVQEWLGKVDKSTQNELAPSGEFATNWKQLVEEKYRVQANKVPEILIPLESTEGGLAFTVTEDQFHYFVDRIVLEYATLQEQSDLNVYEKGSANSLAKCVWISEGVLGGGDQPNYAQMIRAIDYAYDDIMASLADQQDQAIIREWEPQVGRGSFKVILVWKVFYWGMNHCAHQLRNEYPAPTADQLVTSFDQLTRDEQLAMIANPSLAKQDLDLVAIREFGDESIKQLLHDYEDLSARLDQRSRSRIFSGGRPPRGPGGREGFGGRPAPR